jgi:hypothetical protein
MYCNIKHEFIWKCVIMIATTTLYSDSYIYTMNISHCCLIPLIVVPYNQPEEQRMQRLATFRQARFFQRRQILKFRRNKTKPGPDIGKIDYAIAMDF